MKKRNYPQWDMAGLTARNYATPKPRATPHPVGGIPLGERLEAIKMRGLGRYMSDCTCSVCGYSLCDCTAKVERLFAGGKDEGFSVRGYRVFSNAKCSVGDAFFFDDTMAAVVNPSQVDQLRAEVVAEDERHELQKREAEAAVKFLNDKNAQRELAAMQQARDELIRRRQQNAYGPPDSMNAHLNEHLRAYEAMRRNQKNF